MNIEKLIATSDVLFKAMKDEQYAESTIKKYIFEIHWIQKHGKDKDFASYIDLCKYRIEGKRPSVNVEYKLHSMYRTFSDFEENNKSPSYNKRNPLQPVKSAYLCLNPYFKSLVDNYISYATNKGHSETTISACVRKAACFLKFFQQKGFATLGKVTEKDVQAFFLDENNQLNKSHSYKKAITTALQVNLEDSDVQRIMNYVPEIRKIRTLYQFLTVKECEVIKHELMDNHFSLRDKAILNILLYYGLRACDVANLKLENIDWQKDKISLYQSKTLNLVELPLLPIVGNSIYDYLKFERPEKQSQFLFLKSFSPYEALNSNGIYSISNRLFKITGLRQNKGERRGTHIFRHHIATALASGGFSQPVISATLGYVEPTSLEPYLEADIEHLRPFALSLENFPIAEEVFTND
ncbi:site-specific recombinase XerD [Treponema rectale]|uniref:Site-specific recombinase XerD n=1 Tax=Treponema rectale TaxID=744512 RepID=A0A840SKS1_9SPIR|nr:tyrosine-type recombinase/integrase [Treponema rectale]MBB5219951.1 site-specific recombinase XerD [Treponema rectale]